MKKLFIPYELALIAKEKGWKSNIKDIRNEHFIYAGWWFGDGSGEVHTEWVTEKYIEGVRIGAPLYQQIIDWLESKNIYIKAWCSVYSFPKWWDYEIEADLENKISIYSKEDESFETKYEALNKAIEEAFKLIP